MARFGYLTEVAQVIVLPDDKPWAAPAMDQRNEIDLLVQQKLVKLRLRPAPLRRRDVSAARLRRRDWTAPHASTKSARSSTSARKSAPPWSTRSSRGLSSPMFGR